LCKSCGTCFMFYCRFTFTCDRSFVVESTVIVVVLFWSGAELYTAAAAVAGGQLTVDSLTYGTSAAHVSSGLQNLDVSRTSLHDALDSLLIHNVSVPASTPAAGPHSLAAANAGCVLNPIDKLYSMQTSYFSCADWTIEFQALKFGRFPSSIIFWTRTLTIGLSSMKTSLHRE